MSGMRYPARPFAIRALDRFTTVMLLIALAVISTGALMAHSRGRG
ncbi:MAG: hypothetical protein AB1749_02075 [Pseudomonadota bacterium]